MYKKATIGTTLLWIVGTFIILAVCLLTLVLVLKFGKGFGYSDRGYYSYPEKADMLYSILNQKSDLETFDNCGNCQENVRKIPNSESLGGWKLVKIDKDMIVVQKENYQDIIHPYSNDNKKEIIFPLINEKINLRLYFEEITI